ncbi:MAG: L-glutamate gamma-semialdehyde dehydrogenase [Gemmatimonadales bacterium]|jgi:1-pyrroline-5-carboxylate dehydrogenase
MSGDIQVPIPVNEPVRSYAPAAPERRALEAKLAELASEEIEIPLIIGGEEVRTGRTFTAVMPHDHGHVLATWHMAGKAEAERAVAAAREAWQEWSAWPWEDRASVLLRAAELLATTWRDVANASTMLCQSKTAHQAEIDAACELIDFFRFNVHFAERLYQDQPISGAGMWNRMEYRPLEGFIYAITPFNFSSIAGNLPTSPALMGNTVIWKPSRPAVFSAYYLMRMFEAAGFPPGVINFVPGHPVEVTEAALSHPDFAGIHYTGSTAVFQSFYRTIGERIAEYKTYPRIVGETGGKDFVIAHPSADEDALLTAFIRGAYEYQGQKCSAASRVYVPETLWKQVRDRLLNEVADIAMGDVTDFRNFMGAVIDEKAFDGIAEYIEHAKNSGDAEVLVGGECDKSAGYFIRPTVIQAKRPDYKAMCEEIFGPVVSVYVYPDNKWEETLEIVDTTSPYGLTGAVFTTDRAAARQALDALRHAAGNFYINDKPTGAVVGQQPFGGARASGTNDKAGSMLNLVRWVSARSIKETFVPPTDYRYPYMGE